MKKPLNGTKTHPLTPFVIGVMQQLSRAPMPTNQVNPGVKDRLLREDLVEIVQLPSPYDKDKGQKRNHLQITEAGLKVLLFEAMKKAYI